MGLSIIMPVYNAEKYLEQAVDSILRQTWRGAKEIILVDDQSEDNSYALAHRLAHRLAHHAVSIKHAGAAKARNVGLELASEDYILFMDADDLLVEDALEKLFLAMEKDATSEVVFGQAIDFISPELTDEQKQTLKVREQAYYGVLPGCALIKKKVFDRCGYFDESLSSGETVAWMMNLKELGIITLNINHPTLMRRLHLTNTGRLKRNEEMKNYAAILRKRMLKS